MSMKFEVENMKFEVEIKDHRPQHEAPLWAVELLDQGALILERLGPIMATLEELNALLVTIGDEVGKVSADTDNLLAQLQAIPPGGLTPAQQQAIDTAVASAQSIATRLQALDDKVPETPPA